MTALLEDAVISKINSLSDLHGLRSSLNYRKAELLRSVIPPEVQAEIDAIESEFKEQTSALDANITALEKDVRASTLALGHTVKGTFLRVEVQTGRVTWDTSGLTKLIRRYPWLKDYQKVGDPFVRITEIK